MRRMFGIGVLVLGTMAGTAEAQTPAPDGRRWNLGDYTTHLWLSGELSKTFTPGGWGVVGTAEARDLGKRDPGDRPDRFVIAAGPRYRRDALTFDLLGGVEVGERLDGRTSARGMFGGRAEYFCFPCQASAVYEYFLKDGIEPQLHYSFLEANYFVMPFLALGGESENFYHGPQYGACTCPQSDPVNRWSIGPKAVLKFKRVWFDAAYQLHLDAPNRLYFRVKVKS